MLRKYFNPFLSLLLILSLTTFAYSNTFQFKGEGSAVIINDDINSAVGIASEAAIKKALSQAFESIIQKGTKDEINYNLKKASIIKNSLSFIKERKEINRQIIGRMLKIEMGIAVDDMELKKYLGEQGILVTETFDKKQAEFPAVMVIVSEELNGNINTMPYSATTIRERLINKNFDVVDKNITQKAISHDQAVQAILRGDMSAAQSLSLQYGAGIIIKGKTVVQQSALKSGGMQVYGANVNLEAIKADSGQILAAASADGNFPHINALTGSKNASQEAAGKAIDKLIKKLEKDFESTGDSVMVSIANINFSQLAIIKKILKRDFPAITQIKEKSFNGNIAKLDIKLQKSIASFADDVALKDFGTFKLEVVNYSAGKIDFALVMK